METVETEGPDARACGGISACAARTERVRDASAALTPCIALTLRPWCIPGTIYTYCGTFALRLSNPARGTRADLRARRTPGFRGGPAKRGLTRNRLLGDSFPTRPVTPR